MPTAVDPSEWELDLGLPNDIDAYVVNPRFGVRDEYAAKAGTEQILFLIDFASPEGELLGSQGYSIGSEWAVSEDGKTIDHPKRKNVVQSTVYGQLQRQVVKVLGVNMAQFGSPKNADSWAGVGFHWNMLPHTTLKEGVTAMALMPTSFIGKLSDEQLKELMAKVGSSASPTATAEEVTVSDVTKAQLTNLAKLLDVADFQKTAMGLENVAKDRPLVAQLLDESENGFWAKARAG